MGLDGKEALIVEEEVGEGGAGEVVVAGGKEVSYGGSMEGGLSGSGPIWVEMEDGVDGFTVGSMVAVVKHRATDLNKIQQEASACSSEQEDVAIDRLWAMDYLNGQHQKGGSHGTMVDLATVAGEW